MTEGRGDQLGYRPQVGDGSRFFYTSLISWLQRLDRPESLLFFIG